MKKDQVYEIDLERPLNETRRIALEKEIEARAQNASEPVTYAWDADDDHRLKVTIGPVSLDIHFEDTLVTIAVEAPAWARLMITKEKEEELQDLLLSILDNAHLTEAPPPKQSALTP